MVCNTNGCPNDAWPGCKECANCWEVKRRLKDFLKTEGGRRFVKEQMILSESWNLAPSVARLFADNMLSLENVQVLSKYPIIYQNLFAVDALQLTSQELKRTIDKEIQRVGEMQL